MLESVDVGRQSVDPYEATVGSESVALLRGMRVLHLNATPYGGGVAEILRSQVPLLRDLGLAADWKIVTGDKDFFTVTKTMHNALQGAPRSLTEHEKEVYLTYSTRNARLLEEVPDLPLVGAMALDDPEGWEVYREIKEASREDPDIDIFTNLTGVGNVEVNAFQRLSDVCVQKSIREGFGLVVSETLWKGTPMVAGRAGGIPLQMRDGVGGFLVDSLEECAEKILRLLRDPEEGAELGARGKELVRKNFLLTRLIADELALYSPVLECHSARTAVGERAEDAT